VQSYIGPPETDPCLSWKAALDAESQNSARLANELNALQNAAEQLVLAMDVYANPERIPLGIVAKLEDLRAALKAGKAT
jgi:hypothetical protein